MSPGVLLYNNVLESLMFQRYDTGVQLPAPGASPPLRHVPEQCMATSLNSVHVLALGWLPCALRMYLCVS